MYDRNTVLALCVIVMLPIAFLGATIPPPTHAKFVLAAHTWSYPDEYGQGIEYAYFIVSKPHDTPVNYSYQYFNGTESAGLDIPNNSSVFMRVAVWLNSTLHGYTFAEGRDQYTRVGIEITLPSGTVFSQQNLTQAGGSSAGDPLWLYYYTITLNGSPLWIGPDFQAGNIYTVVVTYEIFY